MAVGCGDRLWRLRLFWDAAAAARVGRASGSRRRAGALTTPRRCTSACPLAVPAHRLPLDLSLRGRKAGGSRGRCCCCCGGDCWCWRCRLLDGRLGGRRHGFEGQPGRGGVKVRRQSGSWQGGGGRGCCGCRRSGQRGEGEADEGRGRGKQIGRRRRRQRRRRRTAHLCRLPFAPRIPSPPKAEVPSAPAAAMWRPTKRFHAASFPNSSRHDQRRRVRNCRPCSAVKPMAPCT